MSAPIRYAILIPAYHPDARFLPFVKELREHGHFVLVIDDGSGPECALNFTQAEQAGCVVLRHEQNQGKGQAPRTGFQELIRLNQKGMGFDYAITADCDGQHSYDAISDVAAAAQNSMKDGHKPAMIIGGRFRDTGEKIPLKSRIGNSFTRGLFRLATGVKIYDTQTGLRAVPAELFEKMLEIKGDRYEYEMNMLLSIRSWGIPYEEIAITTIYYDNNAGSHFHPFRDSFLVISQILKFACASLLSFLVDYVLFLVFIWLLERCMEVGHDLSYAVSYAAARILSGVVNYVLNAKVVFGSMTRHSFAKYFLVWICILTIGTLGGTLLRDVLGLPGILCKIFVDLPLFFGSYFIQKHFVFKK